MAQNYDHGGYDYRTERGSLRLAIIAGRDGDAIVRLLDQPLRKLGYEPVVAQPAEAAATAADAMLWLAAPDQQIAVEAAIAAGCQPIVLAVPADSIDEWSFAIGVPGVELVPESDHEGLIRAVGRAPARTAAIARDSAADDPVQRLRELGAEVARIAQALDSLGNGPAVADRRPPYRGDPGDGTPMTAKDIRAIIRARRLRDQFFAGELFADPAWDILLDLMAAKLEGRDVGVSSLCIAAAVPPTTALRWISAMTEQGMLVRVADADDRRRVFIRLSADAAERMAACLTALGRHAGPVA